MMMCLVKMILYYFFLCAKIKILEDVVRYLRAKISSRGT